jgi:hypothetical protein
VVVKIVVLCHGKAKEKIGAVSKSLVLIEDLRNLK